jgi:hypothetical protein
MQGSMDQLIVHASMLHKRGGGTWSSAWRVRWFELLPSGELSWCSQENKKKGSAVEKGRLNVCDYQVHDNSDKTYNQKSPSLSFKLRPGGADAPDRVFYLCAESAQDKALWLECLRKVQLELSSPGPAVSDASQASAAAAFPAVRVSNDGEIADTSTDAAGAAGAGATMVVLNSEGKTTQQQDRVARGTSLFHTLDPAATGTVTLERLAEF